MGMFDYITHVDPEARKCPECGAREMTIQSKCGPCDLLHIPFWEVDSFTVYCNVCNYSAYYIRKDKRQPLPFDAYRKVENSWDEGYEQHYAPDA